MEYYSINFEIFSSNHSKDVRKILVIVHYFIFLNLTLTFSQWWLLKQENSWPGNIYVLCAVPLGCLHSNVLNNKFKLGGRDLFPTSSFLPPLRKCSFQQERERKREREKNRKERNGDTKRHTHTQRRRERCRENKGRMRKLVC